MQTFLKSPKFVAIAFGAAGLLLLESRAGANVVVNYDFEANPSNQSQQHPAVTFVGQGAIAATGNTWNSLAATPTAGGGSFSTFLDFTQPVTVSNALDSTGVATGQSLTLNGTSGPAAIFELDNGNPNLGVQAANAADLLRENVLRDTTVTITGLTAGAVYNLALYGSGDFAGSGGAAFTVNGFSAGATTGTTGAHASLTVGEDYILASTTADESGEITITDVANGGSDAHWNGVQIADVPEPGALGLFGSAAMVFGLRRPRRAAV